MDVLDKITNLVKKHKAQLVIVSKTYPAARVREVYDRGYRAFGENRVQELVDKKDELPDDIEWHLIGHLQRNKVKYIAPFVAMIHSVDSERLLREIDKQAKRADRVIDILLQAHIAEEKSKFGLSVEELTSLAAKISQQEFPNIRCRGVMGMATFSEDKDLVRSEFALLRNIFTQVKADYISEPSFDTISMGMSGDYEVALEEGSTMLRIGSLIFGEREK